MKTIQLMMKMQFSSSIHHLTKVNETFDIGLLRIAYPETNRNKTCITKDVFEKCKNTLYNCPIVANYDPDTKMIGGHDTEFLRNDDGTLKMINVTHPIGCVPESANIYWEQVGDKEYLVTDVLLWKRQPAYEYIKEHGITKHSMEIGVKQGQIIDGIYTISDFVFTALCLLGDNEEPCFEDSSLQVFALDNVQQEYMQMMEEVQQIYTAKNDKEDEMMDKLALLEQFGFSQKELDFDINSLEFDELQAKLIEMKSQKDDKQFSLNVLEMVDEITLLVSEEKLVDPFWEYEHPRYQLIEIQGEEQEVIVCDSKDNWKLFGVPMIINGDAIFLDFENKKRKKTKYVDFEGEENSQSDWVMDYVSKLNKFAQEKYDLASKDLKQVQKSLDEITEKYNVIKGDMEKIASQERKEKIRKVFETFDQSLEGVEEYEALKSQAEQIADTPDEIQKKCFILLGEKELASFNKKANSQKKPESLVSFSLLHSNNEEEPYGGLYKKYGRAN